MGHRKEQIGSSLHRIVQEILVRGLGDPRIRGLITVTQVEVSPDLRDAVVNVSILPQERQRLTMQGLADATLRIQHLLNSQMSMRRPPHIAFRLDERLKKQANLLAAIRQGIEEDEQRRQTAPESESLPSMPNSAENQSDDRVRSGAAPGKVDDHNNDDADDGYDSAGGTT